MQQLEGTKGGLRNPLQCQQAEAALEGSRWHVVLFEDVGKGPEAVALDEPGGLHHRLDDNGCRIRLVVQVISRVAAVLGFLLAAVAMYTAFALLMEDSRGREVLPIGRLAMARHATHGNLAMQLRDIERQAGVRRTL